MNKLIECNKMSCNMCVLQIYSLLCVSVQSHILRSIAQDEKKAERRRTKIKKVY